MKVKKRIKSFFVGLLIVVLITPSVPSVFADSTSLADPHSSHTVDNDFLVETNNTVSSSDFEEVPSENSSSITETRPDSTGDEVQNTSSSEEVFRDGSTETDISENTSEMSEVSSGMFESDSEDKENQIEELSLDKEVGVVVTPYDQRIVKKNWDIWDQPYTSQAISLGKTTSYYDKVVTVTKEAVSNNTKYALISIEENGIHKEIGWLNTNGLDSVDPFLSEEGMLIKNTYRYITKNNWDVWNKPYKSGANSVANTKEYLNEKVLITRRAKTSSAVYSKIWVYKNNRYNYLGWINEAGLSDAIPEINQMSGQLIPNTYGKILKKNWTIWEKPYKPGTKAMGNTSNYMNQTVLFTRKAKTNYGTYSKMWARKNGKYQFVGWVSDSGTTLGDRVEYSKSVSIPMKKLTKKNWTIWDQPYVYGAKNIGNTTNYYSQNLQVISEAKTNYGTYYEVKSYGKRIGWISSAGFTNLTNEFIVPLIWANQINTAGYAPSGCAACAAYVILHSKNAATDKSLTWFYNNLPLHHSNPDIGQIGNPWTYHDFRAVISPVGLSNFMNNLGGNTEIITGKSLDYVKEELRKGNPVLFWGRVGLSDVTSSSTTHVMIFMGYKDGAFLVQDAAYGDISMGRRWFSETRVENYLNIKGRKMVVAR